MTFVLILFLLTPCILGSLLFVDSILQRRSNKELIEELKLLSYEKTLLKNRLECQEGLIQAIQEASDEKR